MLKVDYVNLGRRIRERRKALGLTQAELAEMIDRSSTFIGHIERATRIPSLNTVVELCYALETSLDMLLCDTLPENRFVNDTPLKLRQMPCVLHNTLTNWLSTDLPDDCMFGEASVDLSSLPPIGFVTLDEELAPLC